VECVCKEPDANALQQDLAYNLASTFVKNYTGKYLTQYQQFHGPRNETGRLYLKGIMAQNTGQGHVPRCHVYHAGSYGKVADYKPRDAVHYDYVTTMKGVLEKYKPGDYEFDLPAKVVELARKRFWAIQRCTHQRPGGGLYYNQRHYRRQLRLAGAERQW
jgi:hypothetical protein